MALSIIGTPAAAAATTITLPTHAVGDIIVLAAFSSNISAPAAPAAAGTVPTWVNIDGNLGANSCAMRTAYAIATATNHTSGTWSGAACLAVITIRGQAVSPIGGHLESGGGAGTVSTAPAVTMTTTDGTSFLLEFHGMINGSTVTVSGAPSGYTRQAIIASATVALCLNTKDSTTSDGSVNQATTGAALTGYRGSTVEILALAGAAPVGRLLSVRQAVNRASRY